jgi:hypothetical protein
LPRGACTGTLIPEGPSFPPTSPPTGIPSPLTPSPTDVPTHQDRGTCADSELGFRKNGKNRMCSWVARNIQKRCNIKGVSTHCPLTCNDTLGSCYTCVDSSRRFVLSSGKSKTCKWVKNKNTEVRCRNDGVDTTCQATCGFCE